MDATNGNDALLERLSIMATKPSENIEGIRSAAGKLCNRATSQDKQVKQKLLERLWKKEKGSLALLLGLLETVRDPVTCCSLASILHECVSAKAGKNRNAAISQLLQVNASQSLIKLVNGVQARDGAAANETLVHEILWVLSQLAQRDGKFSLKTRLLGAIKTFHFYLKSFYSNSKLVYPILLIIKALARNNNTAYALAKDGIVSTMEKVLQSIGFTSSAKLRIAMNVLSHLSKNKVCCGRIVESSCLTHVLKVLERWDRYDGKLKIKLSHYAIVTLQRVCYLKSGRKVFKSLSGLELVYKFSQTCPDEKAFDPLLARVCGIINFCLERRSLPVESVNCPLKFPLPAVSQSHLDDTSELKFEGCAEFDDLDSEDDLVDSEEESVGQIQGMDPEQAKMTPAAARKRSLDDLHCYAKYLVAGNLTSCSKNIQDQKRCLQTNHKMSGGAWGDTRCGPQPTNPRDISLHSKGLTMLEGLPCDPQLSILMAASRVRSVLPIVKVAYPELLGCGGVGRLQPLHTRDRSVIRQRLGTNVQRAIQKKPSLYEVVYDLDILSAGWISSCNLEMRGLSNNDERCVGEKLPYHHLQFESRFESGNLRKAVQVGLREYELVLCPDVNSAHHHLWFYFQVSNMDTSAPYVFNIVNCEKVNSQFNFGMKPVIFSVQEAMLGRPGWVRGGRDICYHRNSYQKASGHQKCYFTTTFTIDFPHDYDVVYVAYHFPYTYSHLMRRISQWQHGAHGMIMRVQPLCESLNKNQLPVITITGPDSDSSPLSERKTVFLTGRVHPGESNASWIMDGVLDRLAGSSAAARTLRWRYIFVIIPMLNVEGVINGCSRCGLSNEDLNRRWKNPHPVLHPEIYHAKGLLEYYCRVLRRPPVLYCDFHGHSRKKNVFLYGCAGAESWTDVDRIDPPSPINYLLPAHLMSQQCPAFSIDLCKWRVERGRESTARVAVWRDFAIKKSYTLEASYCGCDQGPYADHHLDTIHLQQTGQQFCEMLGCLLEESSWCEQHLADTELYSAKIIVKKDDFLMDQSTDTGSDTPSEDEN